MSLKSRLILSMVLAIISLHAVNNTAKADTYRELAQMMASTQQG